MVRASLVDDEPNVRTAAAKAFDILQEHIGAKAIDQTIPTLLEALRQPGQSSGTALQALREVMSVSILLPFIASLYANIIAGARIHRVPSAHPYPDRNTNVRFQRPCTRFARFCGRQRSQQAPHGYPHRLSTGNRRSRRRGPGVALCG